MAGLVADYGSDNDSNFTDSDEDYQVKSSEVDIFLKEEQSNIQGIGHASGQNDQSVPTDGRNSCEVKNDCERIEGHVVDHSESDNDSDSFDEGKTTDCKVEPETLERLPNPLLQEESKVSHSVFSSEYDHREQAKRSILEKHVKLTDDELEKRRSRPVCRSFLKGKCRHGLRCKFRHDRSESVDNDVRTSHMTLNNEGPRVFQHTPVMLQPGHSVEYEADVVDDDKYGNTQRRKRRYGVKDSLVPPKNALRELEKQRRKDRPWTVD